MIASSVILEEDEAPSSVIWNEEGYLVSIEELEPRFGGAHL